MVYIMIFPRRQDFGVGDGFLDIDFLGFRTDEIIHTPSLEFPTTFFILRFCVLTSGPHPISVRSRAVVVALDDSPQTPLFSKPWSSGLWLRDQEVPLNRCTWVFVFNNGQRQLVSVHACKL